jgi:hypothetical protein
MNTPTQETRPGRCLERAVPWSVLVGFLVLALISGCDRKPSLAGGKGTGGMSLLEAQLKEMSGDARVTARAVGPSAIPLLKERFQSNDPLERSLVLECFAEIRGDEAVLALVRGLDDGEFDVRKTAVNLLRDVNGPVAVPRLRELLSQSPDEWVRGNAALILGKLDDSGAVPLIRERIAAETDTEAARQMRLAVARLEDGKEREDVLKRISGPDARDRYKAIDDIEYVGRTDLLVHLLPLLSDTREVRNVGTEPFPVRHRVCDRAVEAVAAVGGKPFPFPVGARVYSPEQIQAARDRIRALSGSGK